MDEGDQPEGIGSVLLKEPFDLRCLNETSHSMRKQRSVSISERNKDFRDDEVRCVPLIPSEGFPRVARSSVERVLMICSELHRSFGLGSNILRNVSARGSGTKNSSGEGRAATEEEREGKVSSNGGEDESHSNLDETDLSRGWLRGRGIGRSCEFSKA